MSTSSATAAHALDAMDRVLDAFAQALLQGDADALPALGDRVKQGLAQLQRISAAQPLSPAFRPRVISLMRRVQVAQASLSRRQGDVDRSLDSLGAGHAGLQDMQNRRVYGYGGAMGTTRWQSRGLERA